MVVQLQLRGKQLFVDEDLLIERLIEKENFSVEDWVVMEEAIENAQPVVNHDELSRLATLEDLFAQNPTIEQWEKFKKFCPWLSDGCELATNSGYDRTLRV